MDEEQLEEIEGLRAIFGEDLRIESSTVPRKLRVKVEGGMIYLNLPEGYPSEEVLSVTVSDGGKVGKEINAELNEYAEMNFGGACCMAVVDQYRALLENAKHQEVNEDEDSGEEEGADAPEDHGGWIVSIGENWTKVAVDVRPGRPKTEVTNPTDIRRSKATSLDMDIAAPARLGAANAELFKFLSRKLKISRDDITFSSSRKTRSKCLTLSNITPAEIVERMNA